MSAPTSQRTPQLYSTNEFGDDYFTEINGNDFNSSSAASVYQTRFGEDLWKPNTLYVILGTDSGLLTKYVTDHDLPEGSRYLFIELNEIYPLIPSPLHAQLGNKIGVCPFSRWREVLQEMGLGKYTYSGHVTLLRSSAAQQGHYPGYLELTQTVETELRQAIWQLSAQFDLRVHAKTQLANLAENRVPAKILRNLFTGRTAVLVGAGPSLDDLIPWIASKRDEITLICVSRVAGRLKQAQLTPDIIVTADPQKLSYTVSKAMLDFGDQTLLANANSASPHLVAQWCGPSVYMNTEYPWQDPEQYDNISVVSPTVTNSALNLAMEMGFRDIILAGVDLCYSQEGHSHARGSIEREHGPLSVHVDLSVETNSGLQAETNRGYFEAIKAFALQASHAQKRGIRIINPAPSAARIDHIQHIPINDLRISQPLSQSAWSVIAAQLPEEDSTIKTVLYKKKMVELEKARYHLEKMKNLATEALGYNDKLVNEDGATLSPKYKKKIDNNERHLRRDFPELDRLIKYFNGREFGKLFSGKAEHENTIEDVIRQGRQYYRVYIDSIEQLLQQFSIATLILENRLDEERDPPPFEKLFERWKKLDTPGRAGVWISHHRKQYESLPEVIKQKIQTLIETQRRSAEEDDRRYREFGQSDKAIQLLMGQVMDKAIEHLEHNDQAGLARLMEGLKQRNEPIAGELLKLVQGFLFELKNEPANARQCYDALDADTLWTSKQFGLERTLNIHIQDENIPQAIATLKQLAQQVDSYTPLLAQLLEINGDISEAGDYYSEYIKRQPEDIEMAAEYGQFLLRHHAHEGAEAILGHMKNIAPHDARTLALEQALCETKSRRINST